MPAAALPKKLHARLDELAARVRKVRTIRAVGRASFLLPIAALICVLADTYLGLATPIRVGLLIGWGLLGLSLAWNLFRAMTARVDLEAIASAVEAEFPRLAERLTTAVELAGKADVSNGSPALIDEVIRDADSRARKLDLSLAFPSGNAVASCVCGLAILVGLLLPAFFAPRSGELLRRFFIPGYTPTKVVPYRIEVTSGDPAVKRGDPITLAAFVEATKPGAQLPNEATLILTANGKEERLAMASAEPNVYHLRRPAAEGDFDYRIEAGGAVSESHHVTVVEPITLGSARVEVKPPAYATQGREQDPAIEGLGELSALEHSTIVFNLKFVPTPASAQLEFNGEGDEEANRPFKQKYPLTVAADGSATVTVPALKSGTFVLTAVGAHSVKSDFPKQPLRVHIDEAPKLPRVSGIGEKPRQVRPTEKIVVECAATDDVAIAHLALEWRLDNGPVRSLPLEARGLPAAQVEGKVVLSLKERVKEGQRLFCRLAATDNRTLPEAKLTPQTTYYPAKDWSEFVIDASAAPLAEQDVTQRKAEIEGRLKQIRKELGQEETSLNLLRRGTLGSKTLKAPEQERLKKIREDLTETNGKLDDLARDVSVTPELSRLAEAMRGLLDRELRDAETALAKAKDESAPAERTKQFTKAEEDLESAIRKVDELIKDNEQIAKDRLDRRKLEDLARDQQDLADKAKTADPKEAAELAKKQKELEEELKKLKEQSDAIKKATDAAKAEEARKLADAGKKIADEIRDLDKAIKNSEKNSVQERLAELKKKQDELAKKAKDLADKTDAASRIAQTQPLKPDDAAEAKNALDKGDLDEAMRQQEKAKQELDRLARELEHAAANSRDPREAAKQLARLQEDLRGRLAQETKDKKLDQLPAERRAALEKQQEAIEKAAAKLKIPEGDLGSDVVRQQAAADARDAKEMLKKGAEAGADKKMQEAKESLEKLADKLPTKEQRLNKAKDELANLRKEQDAIQKKADAATKGAEKQDPDAAATQKDVAGKLADAAKQQAEQADKLSKLDAPGQESRKEKATNAMQKAAGDMTAGRPQDVAASQQAAKRELDRLEQALNGQTPADEKVDELAKKQRELATEAAKNAANPDKSTQQELQKRQGEIARELDKLQTPEAATAQAEAADAAKKAEAAGTNTAKPDELAKKSKEAADKLDQLNERVNGQEQTADAAKRLAQRQKANAEDQDRRKDPASTAEARKKAAQEAEELKNMRAGQDAQKAKQQAQESLQRAANAVDPANNAKAQKEAADALKDLADKLSRNQTAKGEPQPKDPADAAERLAKKQKELAEKTKQDLDKAKDMPGEAGDKAKKEALENAAKEQRELSKQANELPGHDSPKDRQQAQEAMNRAAEELDKQNSEGAGQKQKEAAEALERMAGKAKERKQEQNAAANPDLPNKAQADAARQLAEEQKKLQDETRKANEDLARENTRKDNPVEEIAKQQQAIAKEAGELSKTVTDRQGAKSEQSKQAKQAADAAKQTSDQVKNGDLNQAKESGKQAEKAMDQMAQDGAAGESGQKAKGLARRQADLNQKLEELAKDPSAGRAQQAARQQELEKQARDVGSKLDEMAKASGMGEKPSPGGEKSKEAAGSAKQAGDKMQAAQEAGKKGQKDAAGEARGKAADSMERSSQQAGDAAKELAGGDEKGNGSPRAGDAVNTAQDQMGKAGQKLGQGQPGEAGGAMEKAADALQQAANQLGQGSGKGDGPPKPNPGGGGQISGGNVGGPGGKLDLTAFDPDVAAHSGKAWGELPGEIRTKIIQQMKARYGEDYARNIKLYFEQLAERK
jgi:hypothetical protein